MVLMRIWLDELYLGENEEQWWVYVCIWCDSIVVMMDATMLSLTNEGRYVTWL